MTDRSLGASPDRHEIERALRLFLREPGQVTEIRGLLAGKGVISGYFDDVSKAAEAAERISGAKGIYFVPSPVKPELLTRASNCMRSRRESKTTTSDVDMAKRSWLLIDLDPVRPSEVSASDVEHDAAIARARRVQELLACNYSFPAPILADSGNGAHLMYAVVLKNDEADGALTKNVLVALDHLFTDERVKVDLVTHNAARIWKLYGTVSRKGDDTPERPHRMAKLLEVPDEIKAVERPVLESLASIVPEPKAWRGSEGLGGVRDMEAWVRQWLRKHNAPVLHEEPQAIAGGKKLWKLSQCPWNAEHGQGDAWIVLHPNGVLGARCWHNGCAGKGWRELREHFEPGCYSRRSDDLPFISDPPTSEALEALEKSVSERPAELDRPETIELLAYVAATEPGRYEGLRVKLKKAGLRLRTIDQLINPKASRYRAALAPERRAEPAAAMSDSHNNYFAAEGGLYLRRIVHNAEVPVRLTNFVATIVTEVVEDDGENTRHLFEIEAQRGERRKLFTTTASTFPTMNWVAEQLGAQAIVFPGMSIKDHARAAIQILSTQVQRRIVYKHTGWRKVEGVGWAYVHADGAIGGMGIVKGIEVQLEGSLGLYALPPPPQGEELKVGVNKSLRFCDVAADAITFPMFASIFRAALGGTDFAIHLSGPTGVGKSELLACVQQHFGSKMSSRNLPASWSSTGNALEALAFHAKDALLAVDDFAPSGSTHDVQRYHREADRIFRAQGNRSGRARLRADASLQRTKRPRGMILSTGEDIPKGQSLRARSLILELGPRDTRWNVLSECQSDAAKGVFAGVLSAFLAWVAGRYEEIQEALPQEVARLRDEARASGTHKRTPEIVANLMYGVRLFLEFAALTGSIDGRKANQLTLRAWAGLGQAAMAQSKFQEAAEPTRRFLELLGAAIASGKAHVAAPDGDEPENSGAWGWRLQEFPGRYGENQRSCKAQGARVGWVSERDLYLEPEASYAIAQELARDQGDSLPVTPRTLHKRLNENGLLVSVDTHRQVLTVRRTVEGCRKDLLHLDAHLLAPPPGSSSEDSTQAAGEEADPLTEPGPQDSCPFARRATTMPDQDLGEVVGLVGSLATDHRSSEKKMGEGQPGDMPPLKQEELAAAGEGAMEEGRI